MDEVDVVHTGPGSWAGRYLRHFWQPVWRAQDLPAGKAAPITIMNERFTLYRGETGRPHVVSSLCPHRGLKLSTGWVEDDCIRCMYHGYKFDATGHCVDRPSEYEDGMAFARIQSYPTKEYLGLIFAYFGEGDAPPLPRYTEFEQPGTLDVYPPEYWPCNYFNRIENAPNAADLTFAHREFRQPIDGARQLLVVSAEETEYGVVIRMTSPDKPTLSLQFNMPNVIAFFQEELRLRDPLGMSADGYVGRLLFRVPVDDERCVSFPIDHVPLTGDAGAACIERRRKLEDIHKASGREADHGALRDETEEDLGRADAGVILIRKTWERELRRLASGRLLKQWTRTSQLDAPAHVI